MPCIFLTRINQAQVRQCFCLILFGDGALESDPHFEYTLLMAMKKGLCSPKMMISIRMTIFILWHVNLGVTDKATYAYICDTLKCLSTYKLVSNLHKCISNINPGLH